MGDIAATAEAVGGEQERSISVEGSVRREVTLHGIKEGGLVLTLMHNVPGAQFWESEDGAYRVDTARERNRFGTKVQVYTREEGGREGFFVVNEGGEGMGFNKEFVKLFAPVLSKDYPEFMPYLNGNGHVH